MSNNKKFTVRDLINAGLFSVLMIAFTWAGGMIGFMPVLMPAVPFTVSLLTGPIFMLYTTRIHRFGMVMITGIVYAIMFSGSGHGIFAAPGILVAALFAELILKKGEYKSVNHSRWSFVVFSLFTIALMLPIYISRADYVQKLIDQGYGKVYADKLMAVMPNWSLVPIVLMGCVGGYIGCTIGIKILNKHFKKAGLI